LKTGLFFGSFNPIHIGHLIVSNTIYEYTDVDEIWFIVSPLNPHKRQSKSLIHEFDRIDMVERAIEDQHNFKAVDIEFHLPKPNYTVNTLVHLEEKFPGHDFRIIIGEDNLVSFKKWKNYEIILENYGLIVYPRPHTKDTDLKTHHNVKNVKLGKSIKYLVPVKVAEFIRDRKLYV
jgi:nicotinate-nucleotide adenylyltransferase